MKITNRFGLPEVFMKALLNDDYTKGESDYSVTQLSKPVQAVILFNRYNEEVEKDLSDMMWLLFGKGVHKVLESVGLKNAIQEERLYQKIAGKVLSGAADLYHFINDLYVISDYKVTSVWSYIYGSRTQEWEEQLNCYAWLYSQHGFAVDRLEDVVMYRDWSDTEALRHGDNYPPKAQRIAIELWPKSKTEEFIKARIGALAAAESLPDDQLPPCTEEEMWAKKDSWAVVKEGNVKATKVLYSVQEAEAVKVDLETPKPGKKKSAKYEIQFRRGSRTRCERYCDACMFCSQFSKYKAETTDGPAVPVS